MKNLPPYFPVDSFDSFGRYIGSYQDLSGVPEETAVVEDNIVSLNIYFYLSARICFVEQHILVFLISLFSLIITKIIMKKFQALFLGVFYCINL